MIGPLVSRYPCCHKGASQPFYPQPLISFTIWMTIRVSPPSCFAPHFTFVWNTALSSPHSFYNTELYGSCLAQLCGWYIPSSTPTCINQMKREKNVQTHLRKCWRWTQTPGFQSDSSQTGVSVLGSTSSWTKTQNTTRVGKCTSVFLEFSGAGALKYTYRHTRKH